MGLILLEALLAGLVFIFIVWWTMFSGRKRGEIRQLHDEAEAPPPTDEPPRAADNPRFGPGPKP